MLRNYHFFSLQLQMQIVIEASTKRQAEKTLLMGLGNYIAGAFYFQFSDPV
jgi:hypothetical protein